MGLPDFEFTNPASVSDNLRCPLCIEVFVDPVFAGSRVCQHTFCRRCVHKALARDPRCPICRSAMRTRDLQPHLGFKSIVDELAVRCRESCGWTGRLDARPGHEQVCLVVENRKLRAEIRALRAEIAALRSQIGMAARSRSRSPPRAQALQPIAASAGPLLPSRPAAELVDANAGLVVAHESQGFESAVTCVCFGQERLHRTYILLAAAYENGTAVIYYCHRTQMELDMVSEQAFPVDDELASNAPPVEGKDIIEHLRFTYHSLAITSILFASLHSAEDTVVTTSFDKTLCMWSVEGGVVLKVFKESAALLVAAFLPCNSHVFVAANSNAVLKLIDVQSGWVIQKLKGTAEIRALKFDDTGYVLFAGTESGNIHVLEASALTYLKAYLKVKVLRGGIVCITFVPFSRGRPPTLFASGYESAVAVMNCTYSSGGKLLTGLALRFRVRIVQSLLPLRSCYSPSGQGYLISSEDKDVHLCPIADVAPCTNSARQCLTHHQAPVVVVAANLLDTLLVSADVLGRIVFWRRRRTAKLA